MLNWMRRRKLDRLRIDLAEVEAEIASNAEMSAKTGIHYTSEAARNARQRARIVETMRQIQERIDGDERTGAAAHT